MDYFIADLHFWHANIIKACNRPYKDIEHMNESLIHNWNVTVKDKDDIYIIGDLGIGNISNIMECILRLKGRKHLVLGNHDRKIVKKKQFDKSLFKSIQDYLPIYEHICGVKTQVILFHHPILNWDKSHYGSVHLHGHVHNKEENYVIPGDGFNKFIFNVSADVIGFTPRTLQWIMKDRLEDYKKFHKII